MDGCTTSLAIPFSTTVLCGSLVLWVLRVIYGDNKQYINKLYPTTIHLNIQCLKTEFTSLEIFLKDYNPLILNLNEHWRRPLELGLYCPLGYVIESSYCREVQIGGGVALFLKDGITYAEYSMSNLCIERDFEAVAIQIPQLNIIVVSIYGSPSCSFDCFIFQLKETVEWLSSLKSHLMVCGVFNVDWSKSFH